MRNLLRVHRFRKGDEVAISEKYSLDGHKGKYTEDKVYTVSSSGSPALGIQRIWIKDDNGDSFQVSGTYLTLMGKSKLLPAELSDPPFTDMEEGED